MATRMAPVPQIKVQSLLRRTPTRKARRLALMLLLMERDLELVLVQMKMDKPSPMYLEETPQPSSQQETV
jgi:hypothetical protein